MKHTIFKKVRTDLLRKLICSFVGIALCIAGYAQRNVVYSPMLHTLQVIANDDWMQPAVINLESDEFVTVSFDYFSHDYHRFVCHLEHCNADWQPSGLVQVDYMDGFNDRPIEWYHNSLNTTFLYTHYAVDYPNDDVSIKISGNYRLIIYDEDADASANALLPTYKGYPVVAEACFRVVEPCVTVSAEVSSNTDIDTHESSQQVSFSIHHNNYYIDLPERDLKVFVSQNDRPDMLVDNIQPTYINLGRLDYVHNRRLIFPGNNEYRRFEIINMYYGSQNVDKISFFDPYFHAELLTESKRRAYSFDSDHNGRFYIRYDLAEDIDYETDYVFVHFRLAAPYPCGGRLYVAGKFSNYVYSPEYEMKYNPDEELYENTQLLKMGAYDYQFVFVPSGNNPAVSPVDGSFFETENEYIISVYHRPFGDRYDHLIAVEQIDFSQD